MLSDAEETKVVSVTILQNADTADTLMFKFNIREGTWPYTDSATATMKVAAGQGPAYAEMHFKGIPMTIYNYRANAPIQADSPAAPKGK
jgi:hypothetical protein